MQLSKAKELAAKILNIGKTRVKIKTKDLDKIKDAMTREDIRVLINEGVIGKDKKNEQSRGRARKRMIKKKKGRLKGKGKRKGTAKARSKKARSWVDRVRSLRKKLKELKKEMPEHIKKLNYTKLKKKIKGNYFKGKRYLENYVKKEGAE